MSNQFNIIMLSAMHEAGGNTTHRFFDGHHQCFTYPCESTLATSLSSNLIAGPNHWMPQRYAYPEFSTEWSGEDCYHAMADHELKPYLRTRHTSKFKDCGLMMNEKKRIERFSSYLEGTEKSGLFFGPSLPKTRAGYIETFFRATFDTWENFTRTGAETHYVGYIPPINMDAEKFFKDFPNGKMVHIVRNPWSGYADTIKRPYPFPLSRYCQMWNTVNSYARVCQRKWPNNFFVIRFENLVADPEATLNELCDGLGLEKFRQKPVPSFNRKKLESVRPWGTIIHPTTEANIATAKELSHDQSAQILMECKDVIKDWGYLGFYDQYLW